MSGSVRFVAPATLSIVVLIGVVPADAQSSSTAAPGVPAGSAAPAAGSPSPPPAFNTIRTPTSPAFTLLGVEPSSVERPNTPSSLAVALLGQAQQSGTVPGDFAVEFSPYWLIAHPQLTWSNDDQRTAVQSLLRTASLSVATGETGTKEAPVTGLAFGGRVSLFSGGLSADTKASLRALEATLQAESALGLRLMQDQIKALNAKLVAQEISATEHSHLMNVLQRSVVSSKPYLESAERKAVEKLMQKFAVNRQGFFLEVAGAAAWDYPKAIWAQQRFGRWGVWVTPSIQTPRLSVVGVARYLSKGDEAGHKAMDLGVRGTYSNDRYALSLEYVRRSFQESDVEGGHRLVGIAEYAVGDDTWLVASFGRDRAAEREDSLIARLGLSFNFSNERYKLP